MFAYDDKGGKRLPQPLADKRGISLGDKVVPLSVLIRTAKDRSSETRTRIKAMEALKQAGGAEAIAVIPESFDNLRFLLKFIHRHKSEVGRGKDEEIRQDEYNNQDLRRKRLQRPSKAHALAFRKSWPFSQCIEPLNEEICAPSGQDCQGKDQEEIEARREPKEV